MSTLSLLDAIERPSILGGDDLVRERRDDHDRVDPGARLVSGAPTLDDLLTGTWTVLMTNHAVACPVCDGQLEPRYSAGPAPVAGRCTRCGTELS